MKIKLFVTYILNSVFWIQYFELGIFSFNSYIYYLTRNFIAPTRALKLLIHAFNLPTRAFSVPTRDFSLVTRWFELVTRRFELVNRGYDRITRGFESVNRRFEFVTHGFELVTRVLLFHKFRASILSLPYEKKLFQFFKEFMARISIAASKGCYILGQAF